MEDALEAVGNPWGKGSSGREVVSNVSDKSSPCSVIEETEDNVEAAAAASSFGCLNDRRCDSSLRISK